MEGIEFLREARLKKALEKEKTEKDLERLQKYVPSAVFTVRGPKAAVDVSLELNLSLTSNDGTYLPIHTLNVPPLFIQD